MSCRRSALAVAVLIAASAGARAAEPDDATLAEARARFEAGLAAYAARDYAGAIRAYQAAGALVPSPQLDHHIGRAYDAMGDCPSAADHYRRYLAAFPDAPERAELESRMTCAAPVVPPPTGTAPGTGTGTGAGTGAIAAPVSAPPPAPFVPPRRHRSAWSVIAPILILVGVGLTVAAIVLVSLAADGSTTGTSTHHDHHFLSGAPSATAAEPGVLFRF